VFLENDLNTFVQYRHCCSAGTAHCASSHRFWLGEWAGAEFAGTFCPELRFPIVFRQVESGSRMGRDFKTLHKEFTVWVLQVVDKLSIQFNLMKHRSGPRGRKVGVTMPP
jgi:hypothetical protein